MHTSISRREDLQALSRGELEFEAHDANSGEYDPDKALIYQAQNALRGLIDANLAEEAWRTHQKIYGDH